MFGSNVATLGNLHKAYGLTSSDAELVEELVKVLNTHLSRNRGRMAYYAGEEGLKNIGIAIPKELTNLRVACSWPEKAVNALADRSVYDGLSFKSESDVNQALLDVFERNHFRAKYNKAKRTECIHGCAFWTVTKGTTSRLPVVIRQHSAEVASALWDEEAESIKAGLVIAEHAKFNNVLRPSRIHIYTSSALIIIFTKDGKTWNAEYRVNPAGRPLMEAMVYGAVTNKPLGSSRITRSVMAITDSAIRESLRMELHAEIFTSPQKYLIGAHKSQIEKMTRYEAIMGAIFATEYKEDVPNPQFGQLQQASIEPHISYMRQLAAAFSGATDVPISTLGIIHDNPASAEAIHAAAQPLVIKAETMNEDNAIAIENVARLATSILLNKPFDELTSEEADVVVGFKRPDRPSLLSNAQTALQISSTGGMEWFGGSDVCLEMLGFSESDRVRLRAEKQRAEGRAIVGAFMQSRAANNQLSIQDNNAIEDAIDEDNHEAAQ